MEQLGVFKTSLKRVRVNWNWKCWFLRRGEETLGARERTNNKLNPRNYDFEPGTHWWEASALTTAPTLLPKWSMAIKQQHKPDEMVANDISMS